MSQQQQQRQLASSSATHKEDYEDSSPPLAPVAGLSQDSYTVLSTASAVRIYHAQFGSQEWCYSRLKGTLVFGKTNEDQDSTQAAATSATCLDVGKYWFRLLDATSGRPKPVWAFKVPVAGFTYDLDRPFFHVFQGMSRQFGFLFQDDDEASTFHNDIIRETSRKETPRPVSTKNRSLSFALRSRSKTPPNDGRRSSSSSNSSPSKPPISPSMISLPISNSFTHVSHVGLTRSGVIEASKGIDPTWTAVLSGYGTVQQQQDDHSSAFFSSPPRLSPKRRVEFIGGEGFWISGFDDSVHRDKSIRKAASESDAPETIVTKLRLKGRRRLPTPSFTMF